MEKDTYTHYGREYKIAAEFDVGGDGAGVLKANSYIEENPDTGVLAVDGRRIIVTKLTDSGVRK